MGDFLLEMLGEVDEATVAAQETQLAEVAETKDADDD